MFKITTALYTSKLSLAIIYSLAFVRNSPAKANKKAKKIEPKIINLTLFPLDAKGFFITK